ncbi:MAG: hypothetical protein MR209_05915 [Veillonellaceae bacterium]|nr:hypothetical protein [Veillonellaceae bacterium]
MDSLYRALVNADVPEARRTVIGRLVFEHIPAAPQVDVQVRRQLIRLTACDSSGRLEMSLLPVQEKQRDTTLPAKIPPGATYAFRFSPQEVRSFVERLGDRNPLHRTERPLVPGYQIFRACLGNLPVRRAAIRFHRPTYANEDVYRLSAPGHIRGYTASGPVFDLTYEEELN